MKKDFCIKTRLACIAVTLAAVSLLGCQQWEPEELHTRTTLFYAAADNDLSSPIMNNIRDMAAGMDDVTSAGNNMLAFVDRPNVNSVLLSIHNGRIDTVKVWPENLHSSSPEVLSMVIKETRALYPSSDRFNLIISSHGTGWVPASTLPFIDPYQYPLPVGAAVQNSLAPLQHFNTKATCVEVTPDNKMKWMDLDGLKSAIPDGMFDFIMFDACLMGSAEVAYALKDKADWMIVSEVEIMKAGFPYSRIMSDMFLGNYGEICRKYYEYYDSQSGNSRTGGIALVNLGKMENLAKAFASVVSSATVSVGKLDIYRGVQRCDRYEHPVMFDLYSTVQSLKPSSIAMADFEAAMLDCISDCYHTDYVENELKLEIYSGLNCYIPSPLYEGKINQFFADTEWNKATGFYSPDKR